MSAPQTQENRPAMPPCARRELTPRRMALGLVVLLFGWIAPTYAAKDATDVMLCAQKNVPPVAWQRIQLTSKDAQGTLQTLNAEVFSKRHLDGGVRVLVRVTAPQDLEGASFLLLNNHPKNDVYLYLPAFGKVRQVTRDMVSGPVLGTDLSYEDFERLYGLSFKTTLNRVEDAPVGNRQAYVLEGTPPAGPELDYDRVLLYVDRETCAPLKTEVFSGGAEPSHIIRAVPDRISHDGSYWIPRELVVQNVQDRRETRLVVEQMHVDPALDEGLFEPQNLSTAPASP